MFCFIVWKGGAVGMEEPSLQISSPVVATGAVSNNNTNEDHGIDATATTTRSGPITTVSATKAGRGGKKGTARIKVYHNPLYTELVEGNEQGNGYRKQSNSEHAPLNSQAVSPPLL